MKFGQILSSKGSYTRGQYILTQLVMYLLVFGLIWLVSTNLLFLILAIPVGLFLWYLDIIATIKRLHDLGRPGDDFLKTFIPLLGSIMEWKLWYESGQQEMDMEAYREYKIHEYDRRHRRRNPRDDIEYKL